jgi:hypothetical protein
MGMVSQPALPLVAVAVAVAVTVLTGSGDNFFSCKAMLFSSASRRLAEWGESAFHMQGIYRHRYDCTAGVGKNPLFLFTFREQFSFPVSFSK